MRLRLPRLDDAPVLFERYCRDPEVCRYMTWRPHLSDVETRAFLATVEEAWRTGVGERAWAITERGDDRPIGMIGARAHHGYVLGYVLARAWWGRGIVTEAARAVVAEAFRQGAWRVWAFCDVENVASARVMEKAGMQLEGVLRRYVVHPNLGPQPRDCAVWAVVRGA
ncbi:MAG: GNAT family N-acetyltransferase [Myxococcota bacterium]